MNRLLKKTLICSGIIIAAGLLRAPFDHAFTKELRSQQLLDEKVEATTGEKLGQTGSLVALGGLRSLVATMWNLRAHVFFTVEDWYNLEEAYNVIFTLQPKNEHYWDSGAWHLTYNASAHYKTKKDLPPARKRIMERKYIEKGIKVLEDGIRLNPQSYKLRRSLASFLTDPYKPKDFPRAAKIFEELMTFEDAPMRDRRAYLYTLVRIPERQKDAYEWAKALFQFKENHVPSIRVIFWVLQNALDIPEEQRATDTQLFGSKERMRKLLKDYTYRKDEGYPMNGVDAALKRLDAELGPPADAPLFPQFAPSAENRKEISSQRSS